MSDLEGKVAVITGAASGIGLATVETFIAAGAKVVAADLQEEAGALMEQRFGPDRLKFVTCNVTDDQQLKTAIDTAAEVFGQLDILFNNAGSGGTPTGLEDLDLDGYDATMRLLLRAPFAGMKFAVPHLKASGGGVILNTSSISAIEAGWAPIVYSVAKCGIAHASRLAAAELCAHKIRVNAILPGFIATSIFGSSMGMEPNAALQIGEMLAQQGGSIQPAARVGRGEDIANMATFLASDKASFITGGEFVVDGGITVGPRHSWDQSVANPVLDAMGISPEQAEAMRDAMAAGE